MNDTIVRKIVAGINQNVVIRRLKNERNRALDTYFRSRKKSEGKRFAEAIAASGDENLCFVVSYNTPWVIDAMTKAWITYSQGMRLIVVDNSSDRAARREIERICQARGVAYFGLPRNPEWSPNRSHGISLNWIFHNIVVHARPKLFGFLDHDCFPVGPVNIPERAANKAVYGLKLQTDREDRAWYLWAGFCFYRFLAVEHVDLDFKHRIEFLMDTGGTNWPRLYQGMADDEVGVARSITDDALMGDGKLTRQIIDHDFLHVGGASYRSDVTVADRKERLANYIWDSYLGGSAGRMSSL